MNCRCMWDCKHEWCGCDRHTNTVPADEDRDGCGYGSCDKPPGHDGVHRCRCGKPVDEPAQGCEWHTAAEVPADRDLIAEGRAVDAALTSGPWYAVANDVIGGRAIQTVDKPTSQAETEPAAWVADMVFRHGDADQIARMRNLLPALLDALEAAQRPPLGYAVGRQTAEGWWTFNRFYGGPEPTRAGSEQSLAGTVEEDGHEAGWQLLEVREVQP